MKFLFLQVMANRFHHSCLGMELDRNIIPSLLVLTPQFLAQSLELLAKFKMEVIREVALFNLEDRTINFGWHFTIEARLGSFQTSFPPLTFPQLLVMGPCSLNYFIPQAPSKGEFSLRMHQSLCSLIRTLKLCFHKLMWMIRFLLEDWLLCDIKHLFHTLLFLT